MSIKAGLRALALGVAMVWGAAGAQAATLLDLSQGGAWHSVYNGIGMESVYVTALFDVVPGSDVRLGTITLDGNSKGISSNSGIQYYDSYKVAFGPVFYEIPNYQVQPCWNGAPGNPDRGSMQICGSGMPPIAQVLRYVIPNNASLLQLAFYGGFNYTPPDPLIEATIAEAPIPGALPLFASVLGLGGWLGYRRKRAQREAVAAAA